MDIKFSLKQGPIDIEIEADGEEEYKEEIADLLELVDEYAGPLEAAERTTETREEESRHDRSTQDFGDSDSPLSPLAEDLGVDVRKLEQFIHVEDGEDTLPFLLLDDVNILGDTLPERQRTAALVIMYTEHVRNDTDEFSGPALKDALDNSNLSTNNIYRMREGPGARYFSHNDGKGNASRTELLGPGRLAAKEEIERLIEAFESD